MDHLVPSGEENMSEPKESSKLVSNKTYVMYHGTTSRNAASIQAQGFRPSSHGLLGPGVYLSRDLQNASRYPTVYPSYDKVVIQVIVEVGKVITIHSQNHPWQTIWHDCGFDTAFVPPNFGGMGSGFEEACVWDPSRISVIEVIQPLQSQVKFWTSSKEFIIGFRVGKATGASVAPKEVPSSAPRRSTIDKQKKC